VINRGTSEFNAAKMLEQEWGTAASDAAVGPINARWFVR
jgi:hypothetical protein